MSRDAPQARAVRSRRHADRQRARPGRRRQRHAHCARPGAAAATQQLSPDGRRRRARHGRRRHRRRARRRRLRSAARRVSRPLRSAACCTKRASSTTVVPVLARDRATQVPLGHRHQQGASLHRAGRAKAWACSGAPRPSSAATRRRMPSRIPTPLLEAARRIGIAAGCMRLCRRRPARRAGRARRRHDDRRGGVGLPRRGRTRRRTGAPTSSSTRLHRLLKSHRPGLNCTSWGRPGFDAGADLEQGMPSTSSLVNPLETK